MHRNIFRGKNLDNVFTDEQKEAITTRSWRDLYVGDYWTFPSGRTYRIADVDYWRGKGQPKCNTPHIVVVPDVSLYSAQMHNTESGERDSNADSPTVDERLANLEAAMLALMEV